MTEDITDNEVLKNQILVDLDNLAKDISRDTLRDTVDTKDYFLAIDLITEKIKKLEIYD